MTGDEHCQDMTKETRLCTDLFQAVCIMPKGGERKKKRELQAVTEYTFF